MHPRAVASAARRKSSAHVEGSYPFLFAQKDTLGVYCATSPLLWRTTNIRTFDGSYSERVSAARFPS
jgi:hypothetical protein